MQWLQDLSVAHWQAAADPAHVDAYFWVIVRHEIDYRGNIGLGEQAIGRTWVPGTPKGARFARHAAFADAGTRAAGCSSRAGSMPTCSRIACRRCGSVRRAWIIGYTKYTATESLSRICSPSSEYGKKRQHLCAVAA